MIIVELKGGFGNQLFQYSAALSLGKHNNEEVKVDISALRKPDSVTGTNRKIDIYNLSEIPHIASQTEIESYNNLSKPSSLLQKILPHHKSKIFKEKRNKFDKNFFKARKNILLKGNRQSEKYFKPYENYIKNKLRLSDKVIQPLQEFSKTISNQNSVAIHIRRGDYLTPIAMEWLGVLPLDYYHKAIQLISKQITDCIFYIFSDDIKWVQENLKISHKHSFVSEVITKNSMEDFYLMSQCKHNIIANSTFSWWAAWLNDNKDKMVFAPKKWYNIDKLNNEDLYPENWIKL